MSSNISRPLVLGLKPDRAVIAVLAAFGLLAVSVVAFMPLDAGVRAGLALIAGFVTIRAMGEQRLGRGRRALRSLVLAADGEWALEFGDGRRLTTRHLSSTARLGRWWFLNWPGAWAVVTASGIGERDWRRLTARLRDLAATRTGLRTASSDR